MPAAVPLRPGRLVLGVHGGDDRAEELSQRGLEPARERGHVPDDSGSRPFGFRRHTFARTPQWSRVLRRTSVPARRGGLGCGRALLVFRVGHVYPCVATRMTPVTITFAIASGSNTFQPSRMSMS